MSEFFIRRPIFAMVIAILMVILGYIVLLGIPISQYPEITPPMIQVNASYTGANSVNMEQTVATPTGTSVDLSDDCTSLGLDISAEMIAAARDLDAAAGVALDYVLGKAEETGLPAGGFDLVTAACCWHWFDRPKAAAEVLRLLKPGGALVICSQDWLPLAHESGGNVVAKSEAILQRHNPAWPFGGLDGLKPGFVRDLRAAGFHDVESFSVDVDIPYSRDAWRGRLRASAAVSGSLPPEKVAAADAELAAMLARDFPDEPLQVAHCVFALWGKNPM